MLLSGYEFAREAWKRVVGNEGVLQHEEQTLKSLRHHKDLVKRELKLFEVHFSKSYGR